MQREVKKTNPLTKTTAKTEESVSSKISKPEKSIAPKKIPVVTAEKIVKKTNAKTSQPAIAAEPKIKKANPVIQVAKPEKKKIVKPPVVIEKPAPKVKPAKIEQVVRKAKIEPTGKKSVPAKKSVEKIAEKKVETVIPVVAKPPVKKKIKPIGSALVRGKSGKYSFEVFPIDAELKDGSAIYVISKRVTDKSGRGHHKFVCIGQTESLLGDLKKHKKDKCIKQHKANVICLLREENETSRLKIEIDLREAHTIACNHQLGNVSVSAA